MGDKQSLNQLLQWSIENSEASRKDATTQPTDQARDPSRGLNPKALTELLGGPSDADLMKMSMSHITAPMEEVDLEAKMTAFENFEQIIEQLDNANNMDPLGLWPPLIEQLSHEEASMRKMAAWCCSTAVQNNIKSQAKLKSSGAIPKLAKLATNDPDAAVRKKAITALSSEVRNFQPALDELQDALPEEVWKRKDIDAGDMEAIDELIQTLRDRAVG
ncbi:armadillo/beta-catenin-like repeat-containing protein [Piedraia hortae CBS 480.64]|uniref:Armadillo/beta-catenin-like repeat-containing protein n=1 Tax=Piedraia hortae CBS 480.64 TaxID=1314780 RepID=A0A6A7BWW3_9PEZI|nr:armadillo/beta-catenin-like repeat-containing protein [Piedraia hortae CBS 480.64]